MLRSPETAPVAWDVLPLDGERGGGGRIRGRESGGSEDERKREGR